MYHVGWLGSYITRGVYTVWGPFHPFGGAVDIIVVQQPGGTFKSSPWYVRFGKFQGVLKAREKEVSISVNGVDADFHMYLDPRGEAYFLREVEGDEGGFVSSNLDGQIEDASREILPRARSRRSRLFGLVFRRNSMKKDSYKEGDDISSLERAEIAANLLDVKWSTNLSGPIKDYALVSLASNASEGEGDKLRVIDDGEMPVDSAMREGKEESSSCDIRIGIGSRSSIENQELLIEETNAGISSSGTAEQMVETISETNCSGAQEDLGGNGIQSFIRSEKSEDLVILMGLDYSKEESEGVLNGDELQYSKESVIDVEEHNSDFDTTKAASAPVSDSSDEEQFPFSDLTNSKYRESEKASGSLDFADKEDCSPSSPFRNQLSDIEELIENSKIASNAIPIHVNTGAEVGHLTGSVPNIWSQFDNFGTDDDFGPLSHSLDSNFISMEWKTPSNEKECCTNSDIDKEDQLLPENSSNGSQLSENEDSAGDPTKTVLDSGGSWGIWPFNRSRAENIRKSTPVGTISTDVENVSQSNAILGKDENTVKPKVLREKVRANTPTSEELASLNLKEGCNLVTFTFSTAMLGKQKVDARIFLWKWNARIVISDVDGTITKSDVLGQFMPLVGVDWSQTGVAHLFSAIKENGYQLLFLSARAISQAYITRQFLINLKQDGKALPDGPVVISPDGLFPSLFREVIRRAPHEFKIACLEDIKALFPSDCNPFYAGFGNRDTDEFTYLKVGIPKGKIFTINPKGEVFAHGRFDSKSYSSLHALVHEMFPPISSEQEDFNAWNFWRLPPPDIDI